MEATFDVCLYIGIIGGGGAIPAYISDRRCRVVVQGRSGTVVQHRLCSNHYTFTETRVLPAYSTWVPVCGIFLALRSHTA